MGHWFAARPEVEMFSSGDSGGQRKHAVPDFLPAKDGSCEDIQIQGRYGTTIYTVAGQPLGVESGDNTQCIDSEETYCN